MTFMTMINDYTGDDNDDNNGDTNDGDSDSDRTDKDDDGVNENDKEDYDTIDNKDVDVYLPGELPCRLGHRS